MLKFFFLTILVLLDACTLSVNVIHTQGEAADVVDEEQAVSPTVSPDITIPIKPL